MAREDEFPPLQTCEGHDAIYCATHRSLNCPLGGRPEPELVGAVDAFARTNLVPQLDKYTGMALPEIETRVEEWDAHHAPGYFTEIVVRARSGLGQVDVSQHQITGDHASWGASIVYCMHVIARPGVIEVVLDELTRGIG